MSPNAVVTSLQNPVVLRARKLMRRSIRDRDAMFLVEGPRPVAEALAAGVEVADLLVDASFDLSSLGTVPPETKVMTVADSVMRAVTDTVTPQGVVAVARAPQPTLDDLDAGEDLVLVLAGVRDPGNAGTLVRSALGAGAATVVFTADAVDPYSPKTIRSSAGALFRLRIVRERSFTLVAERLRAAGMSLVGAAASARPTAYEADLTGPVAFVLGNEAWGLPPEVAGDLDVSVCIPMPGPLESLNVGIAGSLLLFEAIRQRTQAATGPSADR